MSFPLIYNAYSNTKSSNYNIIRIKPSNKKHFELDYK